MALHEKWSDYTDAEIKAIHMKKCSKCKYHSSFSGMRADIFCDYYCITGKLRLISPDDCEHYKDNNEVSPYHQRDLMFGKFNNHKKRKGRLINATK